MTWVRHAYNTGTTSQMKCLCFLGFNRETSQHSSWYKISKNTNYTH